MDATGHMGRFGSAGTASRRRSLPLRAIALTGALLVWIAMFAISVSVMTWHARESVRSETESAFLLAKTAATIGLPTAFQRKDVMGDARRIAAEIRAQRHVTAELRDPSGRPVALPSTLPEQPARPAPRWFDALMRPAPLQDFIPITQYPNVLGVLEIRSAPEDGIAEAWANLALLVPLLMATGLVAVAATMALTVLMLRRLDGLGAALERMRRGQLDAQAPATGLTELNRLAEGINTLASHLGAERAENRLLQGRMLTLAEAERARIASDLHDEIGPRLFALRAAVEEAQEHDPDPALKETIAAIALHSEAIRKSARAAIDDLRPGPDGASLDEMIGEMLIDFEDSAPSVRFESRIDEDLPVLDPSAQVALYRFLRESVLNALRHAQPTTIEVAVRRDAGSLTARVSDDGPGPGSSSRRGLGHLGMRDRAAAIGAEWQPPQRRGDRTVTEFRIPIS